MRLDAEDIKRQAAGRWPDIIPETCGINPEILDGRHYPCPECGGTDRFRALDTFKDDGALFCNQCHNGDTRPRSGDGIAAVQHFSKRSFPDALRRIADAIGMHSGQGNSSAVKPAAKKPAAMQERKPVKAIEDSFLRFLETRGRDKLNPLAERLHVSVESLQALGAGFKPDEQAWTFPERNADGIVCGINRRFDDGSKQMMKDHRRGLYFVNNWLDGISPVLIVEGATCTAAALTLRLSAIGRPQATVPRDVLPELVELLKLVPIERGIIVVGENDQKPDGKWPGKEGAERTAKELTEALGRPVAWGLPPDGAKDLRSWLQLNVQLNGEKTGHDFVDSLVIEPKNEETGKLIFHDAWEAAFKPRPLRECIIEAMLRRAEVGNFIASTKTGKSWFALMLLICIATGRDWLGRRVARGNVLLIDNELHSETIENRIAAVRSAMQIEPDTYRERFEYVSCRGDWISIQDLIEGIPEKHPPGSLNMIVIDAKYRLFGNGLEENSNDDQTTFHNMIDQFAKAMDCPVVLVHHSTKGDQSGKSVTDVGSGGGSQARAVDLHMTIRPHQQPGLAVLEAAVRSFAPIEPMTLRWNWPLWTVADDVEPALQADRSRSDSRQEAKDNAGVEDLRKILEGSDCPLSRNALHKAFGGGKERLNRLIRIGLDKGVFETAGTKTAQNGEIAELFTLATNQDSDVQRSELNGLTVCSDLNPDRSDGP